jgi:hypothetical protein
VSLTLFLFFTTTAARHYEECYGLAFAQQLKNKDIPEGGSKAVNLVDGTFRTQLVKSCNLVGNLM